MQNKQDKKKETKKEIKVPVRDLKPAKDVKGGVSENQGPGRKIPPPC